MPGLHLSIGDYRLADDEIILQSPKPVFHLEIKKLIRLLIKIFITDKSTTKQPTVYFKGRGHKVTMTALIVLVVKKCFSFEIFIAENFLQTTKILSSLNGFFESWKVERSH